MANLDHQNISVRLSWHPMNAVVFNKKGAYEQKQKVAKKKKC
jgi:hypothetical protein